MRTCVAGIVCLALLGCGKNEGRVSLGKPTQAAGAAAPLDDLLAGLKDAQAPTRQRAALELKKIGADARPAIPALLETLKDSDKSVHQASAEALVGIGPEGKIAAVSVCLTLMKADDEKCRQ